MRTTGPASGCPTSLSGLQGDLLALGALATAGADERRRLQATIGTSPPPSHPHAHLRHRITPIPTESRDRRYLLRIWATISTPLLFVLLAVLVSSGGPSLVASGAAGLVVVLGIEALTRGHFQSYFLRLLGGVVIVAGG